MTLVLSSIIIFDLHDLYLFTYQYFYRNILTIDNCYHYQFHSSYLISIGYYLLKTHLAVKRIYFIN